MVPSVRVSQDAANLEKEVKKVRGVVSRWLGVRKWNCGLEFKLDSAAEERSFPPVTLGDVA
jgi:hypothetical protein